MASAPQVNSAGKLEWLQNLLSNKTPVEQDTDTPDFAKMQAAQDVIDASSNSGGTGKMEAMLANRANLEGLSQDQLDPLPPLPSATTPASSVAPPLNSGMAASLAARASPIPSESLNPADISKAFPAAPTSSSKQASSIVKVPSAEDAAIINEIGKASPTPLPKQADLNSQAAPIPQGPSEEEQMMREAHKAQDQDLLIANMLKAGMMAGQSIGTPLEKKDTSAADDLAKQSGIPVQKVKEILAIRADEEKKKKEAIESEKIKGEITKQKADLAKELMEYKNSQEALDPKSKVSILMRNTLNKVFGGKVQIPEEMSAGQLPDKYAALAINYMDHQDRIAAQKEIAKTNAEVKKEREDQKRDIKEKDDFTKAAKELSIQGMGRNTRQAADAARLGQQGLDRIKGWETTYKNMNQVPKPEVDQLVLDVARVMGGGAATAHSINDVRYNSMIQKLQTGLQELSNRPTGAQAGEFIKKYKKSLEDVKDTNVNFLKSQMMPALEAHKNRLPSQYNDKLDEMVNDQLAEFGHNLKGKTAPSTDLDPKSEAKINMLMKNNPGLDRDSAISALKSKGML